MSTMKGALCLLVTCGMSIAYATIAYRTSVPDFVQMESSTRVGYANLMYVQQTGAWSDSVNCNPNWAYLNVVDNPYFAGMLLSAKVHSKPIRVFVDDSLPKVDGMCQVFNLQL